MAVVFGEPTPGISFVDSGRKARMSRTAFTRPRAAGVAALASAAALLVAAPTSRASPVTWDTGAGGNGNTYDVIVDSAASWDAARASAKAAGGDLATIGSAAEQSFVEGLLTANNAPTGSYWSGIGETSEGVWVDDSGKTLGYTHWAPGEPNNHGAAGETAGAVLWSNGTPGDAGAAERKGGWNDAPHGGYLDGLTFPPADALRAGFLVEISADGTGGGEGGTGGGDGGTDAGGAGDGSASAPLPAAILTFPVTAVVAAVFYRRIRRVG
jgi:hypothetical protein